MYVIPTSHLAIYSTKYRPIIDAIKMGASLDSFSQGNGQNPSLKLFELLICCRAAKIGPASQRLEADDV
jgi:hypothetical protein